jgi:hypothetical protein
MGILTDVHALLSEAETEQLYQELLAYFGLVGASNQCRALESAWKDPYNKHEIEEFIKAWFRRKQRKKQETIPGVV